MSDWKPMDTAPHDGTWIKAWGWNYGVKGSTKHYSITFYESGAWQEVGSGGGQLQYLEGWKPLP